MKTVDIYLIAVNFAESTENLKKSGREIYREILFQALNGEWETVKKLSQEIEVNLEMSWILETLRRNENG